jgi:hypothetical protein
MLQHQQENATSLSIAPKILCSLPVTSTSSFHLYQTFCLGSLYSSPNIIRVIKSRKMRWAGHVARMGEEGGVYRVLVGRPEGKRPLGGPMRRWEDNINMHLREIGPMGRTGFGWVRIGSSGGLL